jgi:hypothetical protein
VHPLTKRAIFRLAILRRALANNRDTLSARSIAMLERETRLAEVLVAVLVQLDQAEGSSCRLGSTLLVTWAGQGPRERQQRRRLRGQCPWSGLPATSGATAPGALVDDGANRG